MKLRVSVTFNNGRDGETGNLEGLESRRSFASPLELIVTAQVR